MACEDAPPLSFLSPFFSSSFFAYFTVSAVTPKVELEGRRVSGTDSCLLGAGPEAASRAAAASAVSMVTAPPASPPRGEDAACRARRLHPGLTVGPGPLKRKVPAAGLPGSRYQ